MKPTTLAEQATLGTLLLDPQQLVTVHGFLQPCDFNVVWHRNIYAAILTRAAAGLVIAPQELHEDLVAAGHVDERSRAVRLVSLMEVPPPHPQAARYAAMVLEASIRRQVRGLGLLLRAAAVVATTETAGPQAAVEGPLAEIDAQLRDAQARWDAAAVAFDTAPAPDLEALEVADAHRLEVATSSDRLIAAASPPQAEQIHWAERDVLAAVLARPSQLTAVLERIHPSLFTDGAHLATFAAICDLAEARQPIDAITVSWQAQREQVLRGPGLDAEELLRLVHHPPAGDAGHAAQRMAALTIRTLADRSAQQLTEAAQHPGITVADLLDTAGHHVAAVRRAITQGASPSSRAWKTPRHLQLVGSASSTTAARSL